jgi:hypothetical protein
MLTTWQARVRGSGNRCASRPTYPAFGVAAGAVSSRALWALVPDPTPRQAGEQIAESVAVHQAVVAHVSLENRWTEPP